MVRGPEKQPGSSAGKPLCFLEKETPAWVQDPPRLAVPSGDLAFPSGYRLCCVKSSSRQSLWSLLPALQFTLENCMPASSAGNIPPPPSALHLVLVRKEAGKQEQRLRSSRKGFFDGGAELAPLHHSPLYTLIILTL